MYSDYSPNDSAFRNPPETSQSSAEMNHYSNPRIVSKTTTSSCIKRENRGSRKYSPCPGQHYSRENSIHIEEEREKNPFEMAREQPQTEEKYEIHETYENYGNNEDCKNCDNYEDYEDCDDYGKCNRQRRRLYCNNYECEYCQNILRSLDCDKNCRKCRGDGNCRNYDYEYFEKYKNYGDNNCYNDCWKSKKYEGYMYCTYDCDYCRRLMESEKYRKNNIIEDDGNCRYYRRYKCYKDKDKGRTKDFDNYRNYEEERYERCNKYKDNERSFDKCKRNNRCTYSNNYEYDYCQEKKDIRNESPGEWRNKEENDTNCNEYYKKCTMSRKISNRPTHIKCKTDVENINYDDYKNITMVINSPAKVIIYKNSKETENQNSDDSKEKNCEEYYKKYTVKKEVLNQPPPVTQNNYTIRREVITEQTPVDDIKKESINNKRSDKYYKNYTIRKEITTKPPQEIKRSTEKKDNKNYDGYYKKYTRREVINRPSPLKSNTYTIRREIKPIQTDVDKRNSDNVYKNYSYKKEVIQNSIPDVRNQFQNKQRDNYENYQIDTETRDVETYNDVKKEESIVDNFKYKETKYIRNPRFKSLVVHKRKCTPTKQVKYFYNSGTNLRTNRSTKNLQRGNLPRNYDYSPNKIVQHNSRSFTRNYSYDNTVPNNSKEIFKKIETRCIVPQTNKKEVIEETIENYKTNSEENRNNYKPINTDKYNKYEQYEKYEKYNQSNKRDKCDQINKSDKYDKYDKYNKCGAYNKSYKYTTYNKCDNYDKGDEYDKCYKYTRYSKCNKPDSYDKCKEYDTYCNSSCEKFGKYDKCDKYDKNNNYKCYKYTKYDEHDNCDECHKHHKCNGCCCCCTIKIYHHCNCCCDCSCSCCGDCNCCCNCNCCNDNNCCCETNSNCCFDCDCNCNSNCSRSRSRCKNRSRSKSLNNSYRNNYSYKLKERRSCSPKSIGDENDEYLVKTRKTVKRITPYGEDVLEDKSYQTVEVYPKEKDYKYNMF
jgi:hypothetical protein